MGNPDQFIQFLVDRVSEESLVHILRIEIYTEYVLIENSFTAPPNVCAK